jgi:hypothetical protein
MLTLKLIFESAAAVPLFVPLLLTISKGFTAFHPPRLPLKNLGLELQRNVVKPPKTQF